MLPIPPYRRSINTIGDSDVATIIFRLTSILLVLGLLVSGCTTSIYTFKGPPKQIANGTIEFEEPQVKTGLNWLGYVGMAIGTGAGGFAGYHSNMSVKGEVDPTANAVYGGLAGGLLTVGLTFLLKGTQPSLGPTMTETWLQHIDNNLRLVSHKLDDSNRVKAIIAIRADADTTFHIKTIEDAQIFNRLFTRSPYRTRAVDEAVMNIDRSKLPELLVLFPDDDKVIKLACARRSRSIAECMNTISLYPEVREEAMSRARSLFDSLRYFSFALDTFKQYPDLQEHGFDRLASLADDRVNYWSFLRAFPSSRFTNQMQEKLIQTIPSWLNDIESLDGLKKGIVECAEIAKEIPGIANQIDNIVVPWVISNRLYDLYFEQFPNGRSMAKVLAAKDSLAKTIQEQTDRDLPMFRTVVSEFHRHVSRLASGVRSAAGDVTRLISSNEDLYYRLQKAQPQMSSSQKSVYQSYMDEWEQVATWLHRISP
jgi:hypothetical protein